MARAKSGSNPSQEEATPPHLLPEAQPLAEQGRATGETHTGQTRAGPEERRVQGCRLSEVRAFRARHVHFFFNILFIYLFMAVLSLRFCVRAFSSCGKWGPFFIAVRGPLTIAASLVAEHRLRTRRLSSCGSRAQLLRGMWGLPRPGLEPVSPALAGRFSTTAPPGKPQACAF